MEKIKVFEAFSGIGTQYMALKRLKNNYPEFEFEVVGQSEIDKFALKSYKAIHGDIKNYGDIKEINVKELPEFDLFTYSFPCQDISISGKLKGFSKDSNTRSSLLWECAKIIEYVKPKYLLMENVKNLVGKRFKNNFEEWLDYLNDLGYINFYQVLNAKDYGIPQNRERVFCVSILGEHKPYAFPEPIPLEIRLKDILEDEVDEKYYLKNEKAEQLIATITEENNITNPTVVDATVNEPKTKEIMNTITARYDAGIQNYKSIGGAVIEPKAERICGIFDKDGTKHQAGAVWDKNQLSPTLDTMQGGWRQPSVLIKNGTRKSYLEATYGDGVDLAYPNSRSRRGRVQKQSIQTLDTADNKGVLMPDCRIRKLTPKECWRLMGISDEDFEKAQQVNSNSQLYKQAGNAIVVDVLYHLFKELFIKAGK